MNKIKLAVLSLIAVALVGCVQVPVAEHNRESQLSVSSVRDLPTNFSQGSTFTTLPKFIEGSVTTKEQMQGVYAMYNKAIVRQLEGAGYQFKASGKADFEVAFAIALEQDLSDQVIGEKFGVSPGLHVSDNLEKGSFLIYIEDTANKQRVWRGAVQGFVQEEFTAKQRDQRVSQVVTMVISQFFNAN